MLLGFSLLVQEAFLLKVSNNLPCHLSRRRAYTIYLFDLNLTIQWCFIRVIYSCKTLYFSCTSKLIEALWISCFT